MRFQVDVLFPGFSGKLDRFSLSWGTTALVQGEGHNLIFDPGGMAVRPQLLAPLAERGLTAADIDTVVFSHLHNDHIYNLDYFAQARFVFTAADWQYACSFPRTDPFIEEKALPLLRTYQTQLIEADGAEIIPGVTALLLPGHTPGSMGALLTQENGERWLLAGDAVKNRGEMQSGEVQMTLDPAATTQSLQRIWESCNRVLPGHDGWLTLRDGAVIAEGGNDKTLVFGQGVTVNGGQTSITLHMD